MNRCWTTRLRRALGFAVAVPLVLAATAAAQEPATTGAVTAETCKDPSLEQPFGVLGDNRDYVLAPGGAFEDTTAPGWTLEGGAAVVDTADPLALGIGDTNSLSLPAGSSAVSPAMCVDLNYPTMRFVGAQFTDKNAGLRIEVFYPKAPKEEWKKTTTVKAEADDGWQATKDVNVRPEIGGETPGWRLVALRFTAEDKANWLIDDVYVDPRMK